MTDTPMTETDVTEAAVDLLVEYATGKYAMCACDVLVYRDDWDAHAATCADLRAEVVSRG